MLPEFGRRQQANREGAERKQAHGTN